LSDKCQTKFPDRKETAMPVVGLRDLSRKTHDVVERLERDGEPLVVTRHGKPIAVLRSVSEEDAASLAFAVAPELVADRERAAAEIDQGEGEPATDLLAEFEAEEEEDGKEPEPDKIEIPVSLIEQVRVTVTESQPAAAAMSAGELARLNEYIVVLAEGSIRSVLERVRNVNSNLLAEVKTEPADSQEDVYVKRVEELAIAERLAQSPAKVE
jgi:prevent-host-death family protein